MSLEQQGLFLLGSFNLFQILFIFCLVGMISCYFIRSLPEILLYLGTGVGITYLLYTFLLHG